MQQPTLQSTPASRAPCSRWPRTPLTPLNARLPGRMRTLAAVVPGTQPCARGAGPEASLRLPVGKRRSFHKPDRHSQAFFLRFSASSSPNCVTMADPETEGLPSTFTSYMAEGERLYLCGEFAKAAHSFSNVSRAPNLSATHH